MPITIPDFANAHLFWLTACGEVPSADQELVNWMKQEEDKIAPFASPRGTAYVALILGGGSGKHIHLDVISPEMVTKKFEETTKSTPEDIQNSVSRLAGMEVQTNLKAGFQAKLEELAESGIVRSLRFQTKMGNVAIELDGAVLSIEGAPIQRISWQVGSKDNIQITLEAELIKTTLSEHYLTSLVDTAERAFNVFVLGKAQNEPK
jgi:hypothetical protein